MFFLFLVSYNIKRKNNNDAIFFKDKQNFKIYTISSHYGIFSTTLSEVS